MILPKGIGNTPLIKITKIGNVIIYGKYEGANIGGSIKDRTAWYMIEQAEKHGELTKNKVILEATSGNTGIGLAMTAAIKGYQCVLVMPKSCSKERIKIMKAYGADIILVDGNTDNAIKITQEIIEQRAFEYYNPNQFDNPDNVKIHQITTAREIGIALGKYPDVLISAYGTTGTIMGCAKYFKSKRKNTIIIGVSPMPNSKIQGLKNLQFQRVPKIYDKKLIDETYYVNDKDAFESTKELANKYGLFCGMSSGAAFAIAKIVAKKMIKGNIVIILPDRGDRYLSTDLWN